MCMLVDIYNIRFAFIASKDHGSWVNWEHEDFKNCPRRRVTRADHKNASSKRRVDQCFQSPCGGFKFFWKFLPSPSIRRKTVVFINHSTSLNRQSLGLAFVTVLSPFSPISILSGATLGMRLVVSSKLEWGKSISHMYFRHISNHFRRGHYDLLKFILPSRQHIEKAFLTTLES